MRRGRLPAGRVGRLSRTQISPTSFLDSWNAKPPYPLQLHESGGSALALVGSSRGSARGTGKAAVAHALYGRGAGGARSATFERTSLAIRGSSRGEAASTGDLFVAAVLVSLSGSSGGQAASSAIVRRAVPVLASSAGRATSAASLPVQLALASLSVGRARHNARLIRSLALASTARGVPRSWARLPTQVPVAGSTRGRAASWGTTVSYRPQAWGTNPGPVVIRYRGIDITAAIMFDETRFKSVANGVAGTAKIRVKDVIHEFGFITGGELTLDIAGLREWDGYVTRVRRGYYTTGLPDGPSETVRYFELEGVDRNVLFQKRFLYDKVTPTTVQLTTFPAGTPDDEIILAYVANHLDLGSDHISTAGVQEVGTPSVDSEISGAAGWSWGQLMRFLRFNTGAVDYIDPDRVLQHVDVDTPNAPFGVSDVPGVDEVGYRELELDSDGSQLRNDVMVWGAGQGAQSVRFARIDDEVSIADHQLWQLGQFLPSVWRQATVDRIADSYVYGSPQNNRGGKDDAISVRFVVFEQGLRVAQKVSVSVDVFGYADTLPIRSIEIDFPTPTDPRYRVVASHELDDPWSTSEFWFPNLDIDIGLDIDIDLAFDPCGDFFRDDFNREIPRSIERNETSDPQSDRQIAWGRASDGTQWLVDQIGEFDTDINHPTDGLLGGAGVTGGEAFRHKDFGSGSSGFSAIASVPEMDVGGDWILEFAFRFVRDGFVTTINHTADYIFNIGGAQVGLEIHLEWRSGAQFASELTLFEDTSPSAFFSMSWGAWYRVKWEHSVSDDIARVRIWLDGDPEPGSWLLTTTPFDFRGEPASDEIGIGEFSNTGQNSGDPDDYVGIEVRPIRISCSDPFPAAPDPPRGSVCEELIARNPPPGWDPDLSYFATRGGFVANTTRVWLDGLLLRRDIDYSEGDAYYGNFIAIDETIDVTGKTVYCCYRGSS